MTQPSPQNPSANHGDYLRALTETAKRRPGLWVIPLLSALLIAFLMGYLGPKTWDASQSIVVREEVIGRLVGPGRFDSLDSMKTSQETIQEASRRPVVLRRVLREVSVANGKSEDWEPSREDIESLQGAISFSAPGGAELGKTEILTMTVKSESPERAKDLIKSIFEQTQVELRTIRERKASSMLQESGEAVKLAAERLQETTRNLKTIEQSVAGDLAELRSLTEPNSGGGAMQRSINQMQIEKRSLIANRDQAIQLKDYLESVAADPGMLIATPRELLDSQPALSQMKNRLIEAQVALANLTGTYSEKHPRVQSSNNALNDIQSQIRNELSTSLVGLNAQAKLADSQIASLDQQIENLENRIGEIAALRVEYARLSSEMKIRTDELSKAHSDYAQVEAIQRASTNVDFMSAFDEAEAGLRPLGPSKKTMMLAAALAGSLIGLGLVMMVTPTPSLFPPRDGHTVHEVRPPTPQPHTPAPPEKSSSDPFMGSSITTVSSGSTPGFIIPDVTTGPTMPGQYQ